MAKRLYPYLFLALLVLCGCDDVPVESADIVFVGEHILTVDPETRGATGVATRGERIVYVGDRENALKLAGPESRVVELGDYALIPGFIDSHGHIAATARFINYVNLSAPPVGDVEEINDIVAMLSERLTSDPPNDGKWLVGYGYDDSLLEEGRHPNRDDLDRVSTEIPIFLAHVSGHLGALNSAALNALGIDEATVDPAGGVIRRRVNSNEPDGVLEEAAVSGILFARLADSSAAEFKNMLRDAVDLYASYGITTIQDGAASVTDIAAFRRAASDEPFAVDIAAYQYVTPDDQESIAAFQFDGEYSGGYRVTGVKMSLDGSPQGRTAWLTQPYTERPDGVDEDYVAYPTVEPGDYLVAATELIRKNVPILVHANGDAAIDLMLEGVETAMSDGIERDHRSVTIHAQLMRADQLSKAADQGVVPSFFSAHTFFWGDWHLESFGQDRGENISPTRWAVDRNVNFTIHNDTPVVPPDMMRLLWATINRRTRSGHIIGPEQRLTVEEALHAATLGGAYQLFEEDNKGSISLGKQADLVILAADPDMVDLATIKDISILETIARGKTVYSAR